MTAHALPEFANVDTNLIQDDTQPKFPARKAACKRSQKAALILAEIRRQYDELNAALARTADKPQIRCPGDVFGLVGPALESLDHEELWVILLDTRNRVKKLVRLYVGNVNCNLIRSAEIFRAAIIDNAPGIVLVHNHPSGDPTPSPEDISMTRAVGEAGALLDIELLDHIVIGHGRCTSLRERGLD